MKLFKRLTTTEEKKKAEAFRQILKYGDNIYKMYKDSREESRRAYKNCKETEDKIKDVITKQLKIKLKSQTATGDWNMIHINDFRKCDKSPIKVCITILEYGSKNPLRNVPTNCFYCHKEYK